MLSGDKSAKDSIAYLRITSKHAVPLSSQAFSLLPHVPTYKCTYTLTRLNAYKGPTSKTAGPAATVSSVTVVLQPVRTT